MRSVRLDLSRYKPNETTLKLAKKIGYTRQGFQDLPLFRNIFDSYVQHHGFSREISFDQLQDHDMIIYHYEGRIVGFSLVKYYGDAMVASQFVWDYADPKLSLGKIAQYCECQVAEDMECTHVYILGGYEKCCLYKSDFYGFEWWTGKQWSQDKELYQQLCYRDESVKITYDSI